MPAYDLPWTTFHTFSYWIHKTITIVVQPASSISESPNTESLKPCQQHDNNITTTRSNSLFKYHTSHCIRYLDEPNWRVYALFQKTTRVQICKFKLIIPQLYQTSKTYPDHNNKHASIDLVYSQSNHMKIIIPSLEIPFHRSSSST